MKKIINTFLSIVSLASLIVALKLSSLPTPNFVPEFVFEILYSSDEMRDNYSFIYDISLGILLSYIFYFVVELLPDYFTRLKGRKLLQQDWNYLMEQMETIIFLSLDVMGIKKTIDEIHQQDLICMDKNIIPPDKVYCYRTTIFLLNKQRFNETVSRNLFNDLIRNRIKIILNQIEKIKKYEFFYSSDIYFVELLVAIEDSNFIRMFKKESVENNSTFENLCFVFSNSSSAFSEFINIYLKAKKLRYNSKYTESVLLTEAETNEYLDSVESTIERINVAINQQEQNNN